MNSVTHSKQVILPLITIVIACFMPLPQLQAVSPAPDGGYPGGNTAEGQNALLNLSTGTYNTAIGLFTLESNTIGSLNTAVGTGALFANVGGQNGDGNENTATGAGALLSNTTGTQNTANGAFALFNNTMGGANTANGEFALYHNTIGEANTATGWSALYNNIDGGANTADGVYALNNNTHGIQNTAVGLQVLYSNSTGNDNTAVGFDSLFSNNGDNNTAVGNAALQNNTNGYENTAIGAGTLINNQSAADCTAIGFQALYNTSMGNRNTGVGYFALHSNTASVDNTAVGSFALLNSTGTANVGLGAAAGTNVATASNVTCIGAGLGGQDVSNTTWIANVYGVTTQSGVTLPVIVSSTGQLGTGSSSMRFKQDIEPIGGASDSILALRPVKFHYKNDETNTPQFGLIAEEVATVNPSLVVRDKDGKPYSVRYDHVNVMLLNEFLREHRTVQEQGAAIARLEKQLEAVTASLQKVSAQLPAANGVAGMRGDLDGSSREVDMNGSK